MTPNERAERERVRKRAARQSFKLRTVRGGGFMLCALQTGLFMKFQDLAEVAEELRVRGKS
jgi:hypothetical protein